MFSGAGASIMGAGGAIKFRNQDRPIISINLEDVILHEEKLYNILEVSESNLFIESLFTELNLFLYHIEPKK